MARHRQATRASARISCGWAPDFIPKLVTEALEARLVDRVVPVGGAEALRLAHELARQEGIFCGTSGGATFAAALEVARAAPKGARILCMLPDTGERCLSTPLFAEVEKEINEAERAIAASTPVYHFDRTGPSQSTLAPAREPTPEMVAFVERIISDPANTVVMFALEWCEFCWSVRRLFKDRGSAFHSVDLDSVSCQRDDFGGDVRPALRQKLGSPTIPQVFVGGEHIGGCIETLDAAVDARLRALLARSGLQASPGKVENARAYLPAWLERCSA